MHGASPKKKGAPVSPGLRVRSPGAWASGSSVKRFVARPVATPSGRARRRFEGADDTLQGSMSSMQAMASTTTLGPEGDPGSPLGPHSPGQLHVEMEDGTPRVRARHEPSPLYRFGARVNHPRRPVFINGQPLSLGTRAPYPCSRPPTPPLRAWHWHCHCLWQN